MLAHDCFEMESLGLVIPTRQGRATLVSQRTVMFPKTLTLPGPTTKFSKGRSDCQRQNTRFLSTLCGMRN